MDEGSHEDSKVKGQVALVSGGSRGIGRAVVETLLAEGLRVYFCSRSQESVDEALAELRRGGGGERVFGRAVDVRDEAAVGRFVAEVEKEAGRIDVLVNNAGVGLFAPVDEISGEDWRRVLGTNLDGPFYFLRATAPGMRRRGSGWVINIASLAGKNAIPGGAAYNASKYGLLGLAEAAMLDLRGDGIRVTTILPGSVDTDFHQRGGDWMLRPEDVARAVRDLLAYPPRALPSHVELRPTTPKKS